VYVDCIRKYCTDFDLILLLRTYYQSRDLVYVIFMEHSLIISHITIFVIIGIKISVLEFVGMPIMCLHTKLKMPNFKLQWSNSYPHVTELNFKFMNPSYCCFTFYKK
jgi:hypothetical protein